MPLTSKDSEEPTAASPMTGQEPGMGTPRQTLHVPLGDKPHLEIKLQPKLNAAGVPSRVGTAETSSSKRNQVARPLGVVKGIVKLRPELQIVRLPTE